MSQVPADKSSPITADMTLLDILSQHRQTEAVFKQYDKKAGVCLCCEALFDPLRDVTERYGLDLKELVSNLEAVIK